MKATFTTGYGRTVTTDTKRDYVLISEADARTLLPEETPRAYIEVRSDDALKLRKLRRTRWPHSPATTRWYLGNTRTGELTELDAQGRTLKREGA